MDDLNGKCVNVVLAIEMGRGLSFLEHPAKIVANFHGRPLESDLVRQEDSPLFNTELVWEIEKKELRKVRTTNSPLRVELQTCDDIQRKDRIGFVLLSTRSANIIPYDFQSEIPFKWYKLLGVPAEHKRSRPELFLSLTIRDLALLDDVETPYLTDITVEETEPSQEDGKSIPLCYLENGYIQIGGEECSEKYLLTIIIQVAYNLDLLLPEALLHTANRPKYFISFNMFGITIKSKPFCRDLHANIPMNEKIVVRIVSEYETIRQYLTYHCQIVISFYCGSDQLGMTKLNVQSLLDNVTEKEFKTTELSVSCEQKCFFKFPSAHGIIPTGSNERQPFIEVATTLKQIESPPASAPSYQSIEYVTEPTENNSGLDSEQSISLVNEDGSSESYEEALPEVKTSLIEDLQNACGDDESIRDDYIDDDEKKHEVAEPLTNQVVTASGDQNELLHLELSDVPLAKMEKKVQSAQNLTARSETITESCKSAETGLKNALPLMSVIGHRKPERNINLNNSIYQQYCLDVILEKISLKKIVKSKELLIKFKHPKASSESVVSISTDSRIGEDILLENTRCKMFFISTKDNIRKMVYAWPPKLVLANDSDQNLSEELDIYTAMFLSKEKFECSYITECKSIRTYEPLAKISITMYLQEYGLCAVPEQSNFTLLPPIIDEYITIQEMQELQSWKDNEKAQYTADLKIVQKQRLTEMQENWVAKKTKMEQKLNKGIQKCEALSMELQTAINKLRTKKALEEKEDEIRAMPNCTFEDLLNKNTLKYITYTSPQLISIVSKFERDNDNLKKIIDDQRAQVDQIKKTALTKEQTTNLLQQLRGLEEKFEDAQKAKTYFKDQWKKAVREIHDLKAEDQKQIQELIQSQKIELSQLSLENFISDRGAVRNFDFAQGVYPVSSQSTFGTFKWDGSAPFDCTKNS